MKEIYKYLFVFLGCMFIFPLISNAQCSYERQAELSRIAANVQLSYNYELTGETPDFTVNITNIPNDIYVKNITDGNKVNTETVHFAENVAGENIAYGIYSNDANCKDELLLTKYVTLPFYNSFSAIEDCIDYPEFKYCQKWMNTDEITQDHFEQEFDKYTDKIFEENELKQNETNILKEFFDQNKTWVIITISGIVLIILLIFAKRRMEK